LTLGLVHAVVDAGCAFLLFRFVDARGVSPDAATAWIVLYDVVAFAGQLPLALAVDRLHLSRAAALAGVAGVIAALAAAPSSAATAALLAGTGNALFHVGAGGYVLEQARGRAGEAGLFVGPGALGLALGILAGRGVAVTVWPFAVALAAALPVVALSCARGRRSDVDSAPATAGERHVFRGRLASDQGPTPLERSALPAAWPVALLLLAIGLRSLVGDALAAPWRAEPRVLLALAAAAAAGKMLGGLVADRCGWRSSTLVALAVATLLLAPGGGLPAVARVIPFDWGGAPLAVGAMLLVQATTGVTLAALGLLLRARPALAFGLGSTGVLAGVVPGWLASAAPAGSLWAPAACVLSALAIGLALSALRRAGGCPGGYS
jgi:FSR family fosmidomycin resistance protein-like MFS transporter